MIITTGLDVFFLFSFSFILYDFILPFFSFLGLYEYVFLLGRRFITSGSVVPYSAL